MLENSFFEIAPCDMAQSLFFLMYMYEIRMRFVRFYTRILFVCSNFVN